MSDARLPLSVGQGRSLSAYTTWTNPSDNTVFDLTNVTARMRIIDCNGSELTTLTEGSGLTTDTEDGTILISIPAATTKLWAPQGGSYDLLLLRADGTSIPSIGGPFTITNTVTQ